MQNCNPMEVLLQRRCARFIYVVPDGLQELMSDISREVLRCNPKKMEMFIADYLDSLLITRENARVACKLVDNITETSIITAQLLMKLNVTTEEAERAVRIIQNAFRKFKKRSRDDEKFDAKTIVQKLLLRCNISIEQAWHATLIIQRAYRCYRAKLETQDPCANLDWHLAARRTIGIYRGLKTPKWEMDRAATLIKAAYKGYYTRKYMRDLSKKEANRSAMCNDVDIIEEKCEYLTEVEDTLVDYDSVMKDIKIRAAIVIQRTFRRYLQKREKKMIEAWKNEEISTDAILKIFESNSGEDSDDFLLDEDLYEYL